MVHEIIRTTVPIRELDASAIIVVVVFVIILIFWPHPVALWGYFWVYAQQLLQAVLESIWDSGDLIQVGCVQGLPAVLSRQPLLLLFSLNIS